MDHTLYMQRCLQLAKNGLGSTYPNPLVGSVIVHQGRIIGEGWHQKSGQPHAEVNAIQSVTDKTLLQEATIYVNLEPCSHFGKTPPCANLIVSHNISNVVIGSVDPNPRVAGKGIEKLQNAGINVTVGVLEAECLESNKRFFTFQNQKRPYIILKWAESADGFIAPLEKKVQRPVWLSNEFSRQLVHKWRTEEQAILVGTQTVIDDNPMLTARDWHGNNPIRIVIDKSGRISNESHIFDNQSQTIFLSQADFPTGKNSVESVCEALYNQGIQSVIIEGGRQTLQHFIDAGIWDEARVFKSWVVLGSGIPSPILGGHIVSRNTIGNDELLIFRKP